MPAPKARPVPRPRKPKAKLLPPPAKKAKNRGGRPRFQPTLEQRNGVEGMAGVGTPEDDIARILHIGKGTLLKYFREELDTGLAKANAAVGMNLFRMATGKTPQAVATAIWWSKARMGWKEIVVSEHRGRIEAVSRNMTAREAADSYAQTRRRRKAA